MRIDYMDNRKPIQNTFDTCCISQLRPVSPFDFVYVSRSGILDLVFLSYTKT
jgi:hypothetical protein